VRRIVNATYEIRKLKEQPGQDIIRYGFGPVTRLMLDNIRFAGLAGGG
jgi:hypothetical protein